MLSLRVEFFLNIIKGLGSVAIFGWYALDLDGVIVFCNVYE